MISTFEKESEKSLFHCGVTLRTSANENVDVDAVFLDTQPAGSQIGTAVVVHGAPGSHKDFKYVVPFLQEKNIRVVGINFPGMGYTSYDERLQNDGEEREQLIQQVIDRLNLREKVVLLAHSRGCVDTLRTASKNKGRLAGVILANTTGFRPHRSARPFCWIRLFAWMWSFTSLRFILVPFYQRVFKSLGLRTTGSVAGICLLTMKHTPFGGQRKVVDAINDSDLRVIIPFSGKDPMIEPEVSREYASAFASNKELQCHKSGEDDEVIEEMRKALQGGEKHLSVYFHKEGHFLQKHRAKFLAETVKALLST